MCATLVACRELSRLCSHMLLSTKLSATAVAAVLAVALHSLPCSSEALDGQTPRERFETTTTTEVVPNTTVVEFEPYPYPYPYPYPGPAIMGEFAATGNATEAELDAGAGRVGASRNLCSAGGTPCTLPG